MYFMYDKLIMLGSLWISPWGLIKTIVIYLLFYFVLLQNKNSSNLHDSCEKPDRQTSIVAEVDEFAGMLYVNTVYISCPHLLPFFSVFFSLLFPLSLRRLSLERDLRGPPSFSSPGFPNSLTLSRSHSRSARALSRRSISRSRSAHWSRSGRREGRPVARPRPKPGPCSSAPGLSAAPKPLWKSSYKTRHMLRLWMAQHYGCKTWTDKKMVLPPPAGRSLL